MPAVAIQVLLYKSSKKLPELLACLQAQTYRDWKLFVCENSTDPEEASAARRLVEASGMDQAFIVAYENLGFSGGHNALYRLHDAPFVLILNDDARLAPDYLEVLIAFLQKDVAQASATGLVYRTDDLQQDGSSIDTAGLKYHALGYIRDRREPADSGEVFGVSCVAALFRREAIESVSLDHQLFDPTFFMYKEDVDLALRLRRKGFSSWLVAGARAIHPRSVKDEGRAWGQRIRRERARSKDMRMQTYRNQWALYLYHGTWKLGGRDWLTTIWYELKRSASLFFLGSPILFFKTWTWIVRDLSGMRKRRRAYVHLGLPLKKFL
jgi:GT2 family glycosyltransferase